MTTPTDPASRAPIDSVATALPYVDHVRTDGNRVAEVLRIGPLDAAVASCPGWTLRDLGQHLGFVHRWARLAAATGAPPDTSAIDGPPADPTPESLADWFAAGVDALVATLADLDLGGPTWHPFTAPQVAAVWPRRQAHETSVHRWDAESATGVQTPLDPALAADGIAEYFELIVPRIVARDARTMPIGTLQLACTDTGSSFTVTSADGKAIGFAAGNADAPRATVVGPAEALLLALWGRRPLDDPPDDALALEWFGVGGN